LGRKGSKEPSMLTILKFWIYPASLPIRIQLNPLSWEWRGGSWDRAKENTANPCL